MLAIQLRTLTFPYIVRRSNLMYNVYVHVHVYVHTLSTLKYCIDLALYVNAS